jgi:hypothetical protein
MRKIDKVKEINRLIRNKYRRDEDALVIITQVFQKYVSMSHSDTNTFLDNELKFLRNL